MTPAGIILPQATLCSNGTRCTAKQSDEGCLVRPCTIQPSSTPRTVSHLATPRGLPYSSGVHRSLRFAKERCNRSRVLCRAAATVPSLADLELAPILNEDGELSLRATPAGIQASVFAVFDKEHRLQYIGFSKDISRSLMTVFTRRPESAWYYKCVNLQELVQDDMLAIRESWFQEVGGPPSGNKLSLERNKWQLPAEGEFIDGKGFVKAAQDKAEQMLEAIRKRGCKHRFEPVVKMMQEGKVDLQLAEELSEEEKEARRLELERAARATRTGTAVVDMEEQSFTVYFERVYQTNGGIMCDVIVVYQGVKTSHRVIVGREFYEHLDGLEGEDLVVAAFSLLISKNVPRRTEGILLSSQFPSNYFSISELRQWFSDAEVDAALVKARGAVGELSSTLSVTSPAGGLWKWNRDVHYATIAEDIEALDRAIGPGADFE